MSSTNVTVSVHVQKPTEITLTGEYGKGFSILMLGDACVFLHENALDRLRAALAIEGSEQAETLSTTYHGGHGGPPGRQSNDERTIKSPQG